MDKPASPMAELDEKFPGAAADLSGDPGIEVLGGLTLAELTTLRVGGQPLGVVRASTDEAVARVCRFFHEKNCRVVVVGGGSNIVAADGQLPFVVLLLGDDTVSMTHSIPGRVVVEAGAGAVWDDVVDQAVQASAGGIEALSGIPGCAGAVPVQNVGAYGVEIADCLDSVRLYETATGKISWVPASELDLSYRHSNLKNSDRAIVLGIRLILTDDGLSAPIRYGQLAKVLGASDTTSHRFPVDIVRQAVVQLRRGKGMVLDESDHDTWSTGSFFTNPIIDAERFPEVREKIAAHCGSSVADTMPSWELEDNAVKLSAAWLIERAGFAKGFPGDASPVRLSAKHTLAITNRGNATAAQVMDLATKVRAGVKSLFGVDLVPEPVLLGLA